MQKPKVENEKIVSIQQFNEIFPFNFIKSLNFIPVIFLFFSLLLAISGRGSQSQSKSNNQITSQKGAIPSLQSSFRKQQPSIEDETPTSTSETANSIDTNPKKHKLADKSDSESDDGEMARPSFSMNPSMANQTNEIIQQNPQSKTIEPTTSTKQLKRITDTGFIVYETLPQNGQQQLSNNIIQVSAAKQGATVKSDVEVCKSDPNTLECVVRINDTVYGSAPITTGKKEAKTLAFDNALQYARKIHYTIKVNEMFRNVERKPNIEITFFNFIMKCSNVVFSLAKVIQHR